MARESLQSRDVTIHGVKIEGTDELVRMVPLAEYQSLWADHARTLKNNAVLRERIADLSAACA
jgi:hypothetical protein